MTSPVPPRPRGSVSGPTRLLRPFGIRWSETWRGGGLAGRFLEPDQNGATAGDLLCSTMFDAATVHLSTHPAGTSHSANIQWLALFGMPQALKAVP